MLSVFVNNKSVLYLSRAPISLVTFSDVWITMMGLDSTWDRSIYNRKRQIFLKFSAYTLGPGSRVQFGDWICTDLPHGRCFGWEPEWSAQMLREPMLASSLTERRMHLKFAVYASMNKIHSRFTLKLNSLLYWPLYQRKTLGFRWRLCCRPSPQAPPRSIAPALWCHPRLFLRSPVSPHPAPDDR